MASGIESLNAAAAAAVLFYEAARQRKSLPARDRARIVSLFSKLPQPIEPDVPLAHQPLAERMRPRTLDEFIGQEKLLGPGKPLRVQIENDDLGSMLFWGPPGCGKTTLARLIARLTRSEFIPFSAVLTGIKEIKEVMAAAERKARSGPRTIVFVDEVHRFNKAQQDAFLPHVEAGTSPSSARPPRILPLRSFLRCSRARRSISSIR